MERELAALSHDRGHRPRLQLSRQRAHRFRSHDRLARYLSHWKDRLRARPQLAAQPERLLRALLLSVVAAVSAAQAARLPLQLSLPLLRAPFSALLFWALFLSLLLPQASFLLLFLLALLPEPLLPPPP